MLGIDFEKSVVALTCWKQMKGENYRGMVSLASVFRNRADAGWFGGTIYNNALVFSREQNMTWDDFPDAREPQFQMLLQAMDGIFKGTLADKTGGAMYCAHASATDSIAGEITTKIGQYIFFRGTE